jgi:catechol 2,3-dioxygenase-like lactoylglutathione lyase family enzyme
MKLDHLALKVGDIGRARAWYTSVLGLIVEFESTDPAVVGVKDESDFTLILTESRDAVSDCSLFFQVEDVAVTHQGLASTGVEFLYGPQRNDWGYGAGLIDPDGRLVGLWDEESMQAHTSQPA